MTDPKPHPYVPSGFFMSHVVNPITLRLGGLDNPPGVQKESLMRRPQRLPVGNALRVAPICGEIPRLAVVGEANRQQ